MSALLLVLGLVGGCWWMNRERKRRKKPLRVRITEQMAADHQRSINGSR